MTKTIGINANGRKYVRIFLVHSRLFFLYRFSSYHLERRFSVKYSYLKFHRFITYLRETYNRKTTKKINKNGHVTFFFCACHIEKRVRTNSVLYKLLYKFDYSVQTRRLNFKLSNLS